MKLENGLQTRTMYSYSELALLLEAHTSKPEDLDRSISEAWLITPTVPLTPVQLSAIRKWIRRGGRLYVIADHTDLFGHAAVINKLLAPYRMGVKSDALFGATPDSAADVSLGRPTWMKTACTCYGTLAWPSLSASAVSEAGDYSGDNFFGPIRASADDQYGRRAIAVSKTVGLGAITLLGDSTLFANFAIYQPGVIELLERLRSPPISAALMPFLSVGAIAVLLLSLRHGWSRAFAAIPAVALLACFEYSGGKVNWPKYEYWSGDPRCVMEWSTPDSTIATSYSCIPFSGLRPRWISGTDGIDHGFWVSPTRSAPPGWKWVRLQPSDSPTAEIGCGMAELVGFANASVPKVWTADMVDRCIVNVVGLWDDGSVGNWWFDSGVSSSKCSRVMAWLGLVTGNLEEKPASVPAFSIDQRIPYVAMGEDVPSQTFLLPHELQSRRGEIYLGGGVTAYSTVVSNQHTLLFSRAYIEGVGRYEKWIAVQDGFNR